MGVVMKFLENEIIHIVCDLYDMSYNDASDYVSITAPKDKNKGDFSTNAAFILAKSLKKNPKEIAQNISSELLKHTDITTVDVVGPGFINININEDVLRDEIHNIINSAADYGNPHYYFSQFKTINVEYVSANPTGPLHIGHCRGAVYGDVLANILKYVGHNVTKEYYMNDAGGQIKVLVDSVHIRYQEIIMAEDYVKPHNFYPGKYIIDVANEIALTHGDSYMVLNNETWFEETSDYIVDYMKKMIIGDLNLIGIDMDVFTSEKELMTGQNITELFSTLKLQGYIGMATSEPTIEDLYLEKTPRKQMMFFSSKFGDVKDRSLTKANGSWTYFAADIVYHKNKIDRGFNKLINVLGADHGGYVERIKASVQALDDTVNIDVELCQLVNLSRNGTKLRVSKREGNMITLADVVREVGKDALRIYMLTRKNNTQIDFDFNDVKEKSKSNVVYYIQYAHARICSMMDKANKNMNINFTAAHSVNCDYSLLTTDDLKLVKIMSKWPTIVDTAATQHEPHHIVFYLQELATAFHSYVSKGKQNPAFRTVIQHDVDLTMARLGLNYAVKQVIVNGLTLLGVTPINHM